MLYNSNIGRCIAAASNCSAVHFGEGSVIACVFKQQPKMCCAWLHPAVTLKVHSVVCVDN